MLWERCVEFCICSVEGFKLVVLKRLVGVVVQLSALFSKVDCDLCHAVKRYRFALFTPSYTFHLKGRPE